MNRYFIPLVLFFLLVGLFSLGLKYDPRKVPSPLIDKPIPSFSLPELNSPETTFSADDLKGHVSLLNVWASWSSALKAFQENLLYFYTPSQVVAGDAPTTRTFRIGGIVVENSVERNPESLVVSFVLTDTLHEIEVSYDDILPDLFKEGQGIVANGKLLSDGSFKASEVLAKHDENYMPPEVADALTAAGADIPYSKFKKIP